MAGNLKKWRDAASVILTAKTPFHHTKKSSYFNYKILTLKRSSNSSFMPDVHVFPGGTVEKADSVQDWMHLFESCGINKNKFDIFNKSTNKAPIFENPTTDGISKTISLRISAIRETFEESGILICKKHVADVDNSIWASYFGGHEVEQWQKKVHDNPDNFLELCHKFKIYPDIWALHEWSNWLTPSNKPKRFDTIFFLASFQNVPPICAEENEVQFYEWATPSTYLEKCYNSEISLAPPQYYEISRLMNFQTIESLVKFNKSRSMLGCERFLPYRTQKDKITITLLPGDESYPADAENSKNLVIDNISNSKVMHRIYHLSEYKNEIKIANIIPKFGHVTPVTESFHYKPKL